MARGDRWWNRTPVVAGLVDLGTEFRSGGTCTVQTQLPFKKKNVLVFKILFFLCLMVDGVLGLISLGL